jgi:hypothetical protein
MCSPLVKVTFSLLTVALTALPSPEKVSQAKDVVLTSDSSDNLLINGDFSAGQNPWHANLVAPVTGSITFTGGTALFTINTASTVLYHVQFYQYLKVGAGLAYYYSFRIRTTAPGTTRIVNFIVERGVTPYDKFINSEVAINSEWKTVTGTFIIPESIEVKIEFQAGLDDVDFEADDFVVNRNPATGVLSPKSFSLQDSKSASASTVFFDPGTNRLTINGGVTQGNSDIRCYNSQGQLLFNEQTSGSSIAIHGVARKIKGLVIVQVKNAGKDFVEKVVIK